MKSLLLCFLSFLISLNLNAQNIKPTEWEEVFYNQLTRWNNSYKGFDIALIKLVDNTKLERLSSFTFKDKEDWVDFIENGKGLFYFNADSSLFIDIFSERWSLVFMDNQYYGKDRQKGSIYLGDVRHQKLYEVDFSNSVWTYEEVFWLDQSRVILVGSQQEGKTFIPFIQMVDMAEGMKYDFSIAHTIAYKRYVNAKQKLISIKPKPERQNVKSKVEEWDDLLGQ